MFKRHTTLQEMPHITMGHHSPTLIADFHNPPDNKTMVAVHLLSQYRRKDGRAVFIGDNVTAWLQHYCRHDVATPILIFLQLQLGQV